jgi:hypothetical protein
MELRFFGKFIRFLNRINCRNYRRQLARDLDSKISAILLIKKKENRKIRKKNLLASLSPPSSLPNLHLRIDFSCWRFLFLSLPHARCGCLLLTPWIFSASFLSQAPSVRLILCSALAFLLSLLRSRS